MKPATVTALLNVLFALAEHTQEYWLQLSAMERVLRSHPEVQREYQRELEYLQRDPSIEVNRQSSAATLEALRAALLQDR